ncbi:uncharacterized protein K444DRAFT_718781 [Hyaloscypha bicolor E]|uniref:Uncharacterized protein n=1 Tax=Hyaloscypha bicolor E TaxID=1095630 RepID=A0A2J6TGB4_9HELO|nr:uncharacterized protein K444DRAFT_718781 [Hyaloscypha bicolor E]PMD62040.1 hypothetical protein K444DRAFT_718781 [Hyaloscypha bicolor E]
MADIGLRKYIDNMVSKSSKGILILLILCASITSTTGGCDSSIMKGLNISASYADYFHLNTATLALNFSCVWAGSAISDLFYGQITNSLGSSLAMAIIFQDNGSFDEIAALQGGFPPEIGELEYVVEKIVRNSYQRRLSPILPKIGFLTISNKGLDQDLKIFTPCLICILNGGKGASNGELKDVFF